MSRRIDLTLEALKAIIFIPAGSDRLMLTATNAKEKFALAAAVLTDCLRAIHREVLARAATYETDDERNAAIAAASAPTLLTQLVRNTAGIPTITNAQAKQFVERVNGAFVFHVSKHGSIVSDGTIGPGDIVEEQDDAPEETTEAKMRRMFNAAMTPEAPEATEAPEPPVAVAKGGGWFAYNGESVRRADLPDNVQVVD